MRKSVKKSVGRLLLLSLVVIAVLSVPDRLVRGPWSKLSEQLLEEFPAGWFDVSTGVAAVPAEDGAAADNSAANEEQRDASSASIARSTGAPVGEILPASLKNKSSRRLSKDPKVRLRSATPYNPGRNTAVRDTSPVGRRSKLRSKTSPRREVVEAVYREQSDLQPQNNSAEPSLGDLERGPDFRGEASAVSAAASGVSSAALVSAKAVSAKVDSPSDSATAAKSKGASSLKVVSGVRASRVVGRIDVAPPSKLISEIAVRSGSFEKQLAAKAAAVEIESEAFIAEDGQGNTLVFSPDADLQRHAEELMQRFRLPWGALVALDPKTGKVLALASHSRIQPNGPNVATRSSFPAASLFKVITAAAAVETSGLNAESEIFYRGGDYTLSKYNYLPDSRRDKRKLDLGTALGKSCNPAFARVALKHLSASILERYAVAFGFNSRIPFDAFVESSYFDKPSDKYELARTAAGFTNAKISPLHAAMIAGAIANNGVMMRPYVLEKVVDKSGTLSFQSKPLSIGRAVLPSTAQEVMKMMQESVVSGTARKQFRRSSVSWLRGEEMAGKTGTLSGDSPEGRYYWFMGTAPVSDPEIAIAALVIDPGGAKINGTGLARHFLEYYFRDRKTAAKVEKTAPDSAGGA